MFKIGAAVWATAWIVYAFAEGGIKTGIAIACLVGVSMAVGYVTGFKEGEKNET